MRYGSKHLGLEKHEGRRQERLKSLPQYGTVELSIGGLFIMHDEAVEKPGGLEKSDNTEAALERMGVEP